MFLVHYIMRAVIDKCTPTEFRYRFCARTIDFAIRNGDDEVLMWWDAKISSGLRALGIKVRECDADEMPPL